MRTKKSTIAPFWRTTKTVCSTTTVRARYWLGRNERTRAYVFLGCGMICVAAIFPLVSEIGLLLSGEGGIPLSKIIVWAGGDLALIVATIGVIFRIKMGEEANHPETLIMEVRVQEIRARARAVAEAETLQSSALIGKNPTAGESSSIAGARRKTPRL